MKLTLKEELIKYNQTKEYDIDERSLYETFTNSFKTVWKDSYLDHHRWYSVQNQVVQVYDRFWMHFVYIVTGDHCLADMDLESQPIDEIEEVYPKTIKTVTYTTEKQ